MKNPRKSAFSLIELIIVISVIAVIAAVIIPSISGTNEEAKKQNAISAAGALNLAMSQYRMKNGVGDWNTLVTSGDENCYNALKEYLEFSDDTWAKFETRYAPYTFEFQALNATTGTMQKVKINNSKTSEKDISY
jgi:prepilin-type N-terminal cleavage/methylation domain-containing protein